MLNFTVAEIWLVLGAFAAELNRTLHFKLQMLPSMVA